jgi:hypothetical protein
MTSSFTGQLIDSLVLLPCEMQLVVLSLAYPLIYQEMCGICLYSSAVLASAMVISLCLKIGLDGPYLEDDSRRDRL